MPKRLVASSTQDQSSSSEIVCYIEYSKLISSPISVDGNRSCQKAPSLLGPWHEGSISLVP